MFFIVMFGCYGMFLQTWILQIKCNAKKSDGEMVNWKKNPLIGKEPVVVIKGWWAGYVFKQAS